jgi:hypothetical protein
LSQILPWTSGLRVVEGEAAAYVCDKFTCQAPTSDPTALVEMLDGIVAGKKVGR